MKETILIIHHGQGLGGGLTALLGLITDLQKDFNIEVLCVFDSDAIPHIQKTGVKVRLVQSTFYKKFYRVFLHSSASYATFVDALVSVKGLVTFMLSKYHFAYKELKQLNSHLDFDLVYFNSTFISDFARASKMLGKDTFIHIREPLDNGLFGLRKKIIRDTINKYCDKVIAVSQDNSDRINLPLKTVVIYDPVLLRRGQNTIEYSRFDFIYLGGDLRIKGFEQLVKSLPFLNTNIKIYCLGNYSKYSIKGFRDFLKLLLDPFNIKKNGLLEKLYRSPNVEIIGLTSDVTQYYLKSGALISPFSKPHASLPILEAFSVGRPVIVSDVRGMDELVSEKKNGLFFKNNNPKELARAINTLALMSKLEREEMEKNALSTFREIYRNNISVNTLLNSTDELD